MKTQKTVWARMCERVVRLFISENPLPGQPPAILAERPAPDMSANDQALATVTDDNAVYRAVMEHAFVTFENQNVQSLSAGLNTEARMAASDRAAGVMAFINSVESARVALRAEMQRHAKREEQKKQSQNK